MSMLKVQDMQKKLIQMESNIPPSLQEFMQSQVFEEEEIEEILNQQQMKVGQVAKDSSLRLISPVSGAEFRQIPQYMINRNSKEMLNNLIATLNEILEEKYGILRRGRLVSKKKGELDRFLDYEKDQNIVKERQGIIQICARDDVTTNLMFDLRKTCAFLHRGRLQQVHEKEDGQTHPEFADSIETL